MYISVYTLVCITQLYCARAYVSTLVCIPTCQHTSEYIIRLNGLTIILIINRLILRGILNSVAIRSILFSDKYQYTGYILFKLYVRHILLIPPPPPEGVIDIVKQ